MTRGFFDFRPGSRDMRIRVRTTLFWPRRVAASGKSVFPKNSEGKFFSAKSVLGDRKSIPSPFEWRGFRWNRITIGGEISIFVLPWGVLPKVAVKKLAALQKSRFWGFSNGYNFVAIGFLRLANPPKWSWDLALFIGGKIAEKYSVFAEIYTFEYIVENVSKIGGIFMWFGSVPTPARLKRLERQGKVFIALRNVFLHFYINWAK